MSRPQAGCIRLATASPATKPTTAETLEQLGKLARQAANQNADILLLPEAYIGGYPRGANFGASIGGRTQEGRVEYLEYFSQAVDLGDTVDGGAGEGDAWVRKKIGSKQQVAHDGEEGVKTPKSLDSDGDGTREELEKVASETGVFLVTGLVERVGGSLYCAVVYVCPKLGMLGKRRKVMPTATERLVWAQGSPTTLKAVSTVIRGTRINLAAAICWENYMPLLRQSLYAQNVNLYLAPTADGRDTWLPLMQTVGVEGRCFVVSSNMCVRKGGYGDSSGSRRKSMHRIVTDEYGNEIVLPLTSPTTTASLTAKKGVGQARRRHSEGNHMRRVVKDEYGNEIVIPYSTSVGNALTSLDEAPIATDTTATVTSSPSTGKAQPASSASAGNRSSTGEEFVSRGGSCIVSPFGDVLAGPQWEDAEGIIYADVDFQDCIKGRLDLDVAGSYSRNDSFKFSVEGLDMRPLSYY